MNKHVQYTRLACAVATCCNHPPKPTSSTHPLSSNPFRSKVTDHPKLNKHRLSAQLSNGIPAGNGTDGVWLWLVGHSKASADLVYITLGTSCSRCSSQALPPSHRAVNLAFQRRRAGSVKATSRHVVGQSEFLLQLSRTGEQHTQMTRAAASCGHTPLEAVASVDRAAAARRLGVYLERTPQAESLRGVLPKCQSHVILRPLRSLQGMQTATMATSEASAWAKMPKRTRDSPPR